jgi:hypothetical protein
MYELNDNLDELFRRAAKDYPLDTNSADWNKLQEAMQKATARNSVSYIPGSGGKNKRRLLWLLLLLLPLSWISYKYSGRSDKAELAKTENAGKTVAIATNETDNNNIIKREETPHLAQVSRPVPASYLAHNNSKLSNEKARDRSPAPADFDKQKRSNNIEQNVKDKTASVLIKDNENIHTLTSGNSVTTGNKEQTKTDSTAGAKTLAAQKETQQEKTNTEKIIKKNSKARGLYIGVTGGPDLSSVKWQGIKNAGLNGGIIIGYQWNKRFSVESGVIWNKKYYYSNGEYFSTEKIYLPPNTKIENVKGDCNMIEWAVNLRYNLKTGNAGAWSVMAGASSYFMMKENYDYQYLYTNGQTANRYRTYTNASDNWLSVINLAFTYSHKLGRTGNLRIEPYIKLPIKGLGIGSLPIMSSGLSIGFIKKIF